MSSERPPYQLHPVFVKHARLVAPHVKRLTVDGASLATLRADLPGQWLKIFVPVQEECLRADRASAGRAYTVRSVDRASREIDIDLYLHGDSGPVSAWAERAQVGDRFEISDVHPRSGFPIDPGASRYLLIGDETALPAIGAILDALPAHATATVFAEVGSAADHQLLASRARLSLTWVHRADGAVPTESALADAIAGETVIWAAGESANIAALRKRLLARYQVDKTRLHAAGYWKRGEADHRDEIA